MDSPRAKPDEASFWTAWLEALARARDALINIQQSSTEESSNSRNFFSSVSSNGDNRDKQITHSSVNEEKFPSPYQSSEREPSLEPAFFESGLKPSACVASAGLTGKEGGRKEKEGCGEKRKTLGEEGGSSPNCGVLVATKGRREARAGALFPEAPKEKLPRWRTWPVEKWNVRDFVGYFVAGLTQRCRYPTVPVRGMEAHLKRLLAMAENRFGPHDGRRALRQLLDVCLDCPTCTGTGYVLREAERFWSGQYSGFYRPPQAGGEEAW